MTVGAISDRVRCERGAIGIEYAIVAVVIALGLVTAAGSARQTIAGMLGNISATAISGTSEDSPAHPEDPPAEPQDPPADPEDPVDSTAPGPPCASPPCGSPPGQDPKEPKDPKPPKK